MIRLLTLCATLLGVPEQDSAPPVAQRVWRDLVCTCGKCQHLTLAECACSYASSDRKYILDFVAGRDLSTAAREDDAYRAIMAEYVTRHGRDVLAKSPATSPEVVARWAGLGFFIVVLAGTAVLVILSFARRSPPGKRRHKRFGDRWRPAHRH
jgi:hypothetical protein